MNSTTTEASNNSTTPSIWIVDSGQIYIFCISVLFGLPVHSYVLWLIITGTGHGVASGFFILNLSCCEICICVDFLFFVLSHFISSLLPLALFLQGYTMTGRPLFQCLICVERYLAVVHPVTFLKYKPLRYRVICCTVAWIITLGPYLFFMFILNPLNLKAYAWFFSTQFLLFFCIQLFCLVAVLRALKQSGPGERGSEKEGENHMKRRAFNLILFNVAIIHVPYAIIALNTILIQQYIREDWFVPLICYVLAGFVQPVLYLYWAGKLPCLLNYLTFI